MSKTVKGIAEMFASYRMFMRVKGVKISCNQAKVKLLLVFFQ